MRCNSVCLSAFCKRCPSLALLSSFYSLSGLRFWVFSHQQQELLPLFCGLGTPRVIGPLSSPKGRKLASSRTGSWDIAVKMKLRMHVLVGYCRALLGWEEEDGLSSTSSFPALFFLQRWEGEGCASEEPGFRSPAVHETDLGPCSPQLANCCCLSSRRESPFAFQLLQFVVSCTRDKN